MMFDIFNSILEQGRKCLMDRERMVFVYTTYPEIFEEHGISKEELVHWFINIKKY